MRRVAWLANPTLTLTLALTLTLTLALTLTLPLTLSGAAWSSTAGSKGGLARKAPG